MSHSNLKHNKAIVTKNGNIVAQGQELSISSSPFPNAEELAKLNALNPNLVDRVMKYTENEQNIRSRSWKNIIVNNIITNIFILIALGGVLGLCFYIASKEDTKSPAWLGGAILSGGGIFYWLNTNKK